MRVVYGRFGTATISGPGGTATLRMSRDDAHSLALVIGADFVERG